MWSQLGLKNMNLPCSQQQDTKELMEIWKTERPMETLGSSPHRKVWPTLKATDKERTSGWILHGTITSRVFLWLFPYIFNSHWTHLEYSVVFWYLHNCNDRIRVAGLIHHLKHHMLIEPAAAQSLQSPITEEPSTDIPPSMHWSILTFIYLWEQQFPRDPSWENSL